MWGLGRDIGGDADGRGKVGVFTVQPLLRRETNWSVASSFSVHLGGGSRDRE